VTVRGQSQRKVSDAEADAIFQKHFLGGDWQALLFDSGTLYHAVNEIMKSGSRKKKKPRSDS
jgi:hypothetical protein